MTTTRDPCPGHDVLDALRAAFPPEWREPPLGQRAVAAWEAEHGVALPEPYRTFVAEIANGSAVGPAEDGGLQPLGLLPAQWPDLGPGGRRPGAPFPVEAAWCWEDEEDGDPDDPRIDAAFNDGSVVLGSDDGQSFWLLVTTGPRRGEVWMVADVGVTPVPTAGGAWGFAEWVGQWRAEEDGWS
ncbi:SMI1/KNR4 family protein [Kitasatospora sp. NPDC051853]|uniref:SMI1/KNR4 family protein n=1 Tax=Kitasatospora sp. NPDC051853 TaxID=3364058 RepID=UPI0037A88B66